MNIIFSDNINFVIQELLEELRSVMNPTKSFGNNSNVAYPHLENLDADFEKESAM